MNGDFRLEDAVTIANFHTGRLTRIFQIWFTSPMGKLINLVVTADFGLTFTTT